MTRTRTVWSDTGWITFNWMPKPDCPVCKGEGAAWQYRRYGDQQYHGEYFEDCDECSAPPNIIDRATD